MHYLFKFAKRLSSGYVLPRAIEELLNELLCSDGCLEVMRVGDIRTPIIYVKTKTGKKVPLHQAPSGIRESIVLVLSLTPSGIGVPNIIFIEEPEAHSHPRAITKLARLIGLGVNNGKKVIISTHSDYLLESINNLISLSKIKEKAGKYGFNESEVIDPESVATYLVKFKGGKSVVKELEITDKGILEEEFSEVVKELADQRAWIYYESS
jgi:predicted ATPase